MSQHTAALLSALNPLLLTPDNQTLNHILTQIRTLSPAPRLLAATIYIFSKLVLSTPPTKTTANAKPLFVQLVGTLVDTSLLPRPILYEAIDLETHQLLEPPVDHSLAERRFRTRLYFTQTRFNLFREESQGYAKLITLMWDTISAHNSIQPDHVAKALRALIGQFSLDTNRVIELVLSAAVDVVNEQIKSAGRLPSDHRLPPLFVRLLDEFARDHVFSVIGAMLQSYHAVPPPTPTSNKPDSQPNTAPSSASTASAPAQPQGQPEVKTPAGFLALIAVLIREGRMAIEDVWHNLSPPDDRKLVDKFLVYERNLRELSKRVSSANVGRPAANQEPPLFVRTRLGASERDVFSQYKFVVAGPFSQFSCQKLEFICLLINMCRWDDAMEAVLSLGVGGEHVDIAAHPIIGGALAVFVEALLNPVLCSRFPGLYKETKHLTQAIAALGGRENRCPCPIMSIDQLLDTSQDGPGAVVRQMLFILGPHARSSPNLLHALCRLLKGRDEPEAVAIMQDVVLPAFSLLQSNIGLADAIWGVLRSWPHTRRWHLYGNLRNSVSNTCAVYQVVAARASYEMKYVLKRLTSETHKQHARTVTKITHGQALPVFSAAIDRIQGYPPDAVTVGPVVDACRDCSELAVDMLLYLIIDRMADSKRSRLKDDGINIAQWYATLSLFLGLCLRKLPVNSQQIEGVLSFLYTKLVFDREALLITALSDVIKCVADIAIETNLTANQITAQGGGPHLRTSVSGIWVRLQPDIKLVGTAFDNKQEREKKGAMLALLGAFERTQMHVYIAIAIAQLTREAVYQEDLRTMPLKLGANIVDRARTSLMQLSQFMDTTPSNTSKDDEIRKGIWQPLRKLGLATLVGEMGVSTSSAVALLSPILSYLENNNGAKVIGSKEGEKRKEGTNEAKKSAVKLSAEAPANGPQKLKDSDGDVKMEAAEKSDKGVVGNDSPVAVNSTIAFANSMSKKTGDRLSPNLLRAFWTLKLDDITVPHKLYETESKRIAEIKSVWEKETDRVRRHAHGEGDRRRRAESELRRIREFQESLESEKRSYIRKKSSVLEALQTNKTSLCSPNVVADATQAEAFVNYFLQECVFPRSRVSTCDAIFCARFVLQLMELDIPVLNFAKYFQALLKLIPIVLSSCSENEAISIAQLVNEVLTTLEKWRSNRKVFDSEASNSKKHGFREFSEANSKPMRHENYCQWLFDIHENLAEGLSMILISDEYLYARNSLYVLAGIADVFPKVSEHSAKIEEHVGKLCDSELPDIRLSSKGVLARLKSGKAKRLPQHIFKLKPSAGGSGTTNGKAQREKKSRLEERSKQQAATKILIPKPSTREPPKPDSNAAPSSAAENGNIKGNAMKGPHTADANKPSLNPNAKTFVPTKTEIKHALAKSEATPTSVSKKKRSDEMPPPSSGNAGKRAREVEPVKQNGPSEKSRTDITGKPRSSDSAPPLKKAKNEDKRSNDDRGRRPTAPDVHNSSQKVKDTSTAGAVGQPIVEKGSSLVQSSSGGRDHGNRDSGRNSGGMQKRNSPSRDGSSHEVQPRNSMNRVSPIRDGSSRHPSGRDGVGRETGSRDLRPRGSPKRSPQGRDGPGRDISSRDGPSREGGRARDTRDGSSRDGLQHSRSGQGRDTHSRAGPMRNGPRRESPPRNAQRPVSGREIGGREANGGSGKDSGRRRRSNEPPPGNFQYKPVPDAGMQGHDARDHDEKFGEGHGVKRRRDYPGPRGPPPFEEGRRATRSRTDDGPPFRDRPNTRDDMRGMNNEMRFTGPGSPMREGGRFDDGFGRGGPVKPGWGDQGRDGPHDGRGGGGNGPPPRRRDEPGPPPGPGWNGRPGDRTDFDGRGRRDDGHGREGEFGGYDERPGSRGGYREPPRRGGGREEQPRRDRNFRRNAHGRNGGRRQR